MKKIAFVIYQIHKCAQGHVTLQQIPNPPPFKYRHFDSSHEQFWMYLVDSGAAEGVGASHPPIAGVGERGGVHRIVDPPLLAYYVYRFISCFCYFEDSLLSLSPPLTSFNIAQFDFISSSYRFVILFYFLLFTKKQTLQ